MNTISIELIYKISSFLVPPANFLEFYPLETYYDADYCELHQGWASARLICKAFSTAPPLLQWLFHDVTIRTTTRSLNVLQQLSRSEHLRNYVRRVIFHRPMLNLRLWTMEAFTQMVLTQRRDREIPYVVDLEHDTEFDMQAFSDGGPDVTDLELSNKQSLWAVEAEADYRAYFAGLAEQQTLLSDGSFPDTCGQALALFTSLYSVAISNGQPNCFRVLRCGPECGQYPDTILQYVPPILCTGQSPTAAISHPDESSYLHHGLHHELVIQALSIAKCRPKEILVRKEPAHGIQARWSPARVPDVSGLRRLDIELQVGRFSGAITDYSGPICALLKHANALVELGIHFLRPRDAVSCKDLWRLEFPNLTTLILEDAELTSATELCAFLDRHRHHLRVLKLIKIVSPDEHFWRRPLQFLRELHIFDTLEDFHISTAYGYVGQRFEVSTLCNTHRHRVCGIHCEADTKLLDYLRGNIEDLPLEFRRD